MDKMSTGRVDLNKSPYNLSTFWGRYRHYAWVTDPRLTLTSTKDLLDAKELVEKYKSGQAPLDTPEVKLRKAQQLYMSAFHPDTGQLQNVFGRMSFYTPGGLVLIAAMITFYKSTGAVIFWQWANQSFNAGVNYTNSNATSELGNKKLLVAYTSATTSALVVSLGLKHILAGRGTPLMQRLVPFAAVMAANAVNIPLMRQVELAEGVSLCDENGKEVTQSKGAAVKGISQVTLARCFMAAPSMTILPYTVEKLEKTAVFKRYKWLTGVTQLVGSGVLLGLCVPGGCALFPQQCSFNTASLKYLDASKLEELKKQESAGMLAVPDKLFFNKGL